MTLSSLRRDRRGIALPVALFALVVIGTLVAGVFFTARLEMRGGESAMSATRAAEAAQAGLQIVVPQTITIGATLIDGQSVTGGSTQIGSSAAYYTYTVTRLNKFVYLVRSQGEYRANSTLLAKRTMAQIVKRYMPELQVNSGAIVVGNAAVSGSASLNGTDQTPPGWTGCAAGTDQPGLRTNGTASGNKLGTVQGTGTPPYTTADTTVTGMARVMDTLFFQLAGQANIQISSSSASGNPADTVIGGSTVCRTKLSTNWGDPERPGTTQCTGYFPIVYLNNGNTATQFLVHANGQGVLLVNGNLKFNANGHYVGLILVRGSFQGGTGTIDVDGSLISLNADLTDDTINGNIDIDYSSCAVNTALNNLSVSAPATYRSFMQF